MWEEQSYLHAVCLTQYVWDWIILTVSSEQIQDGKHNPVNRGSLEQGGEGMQDCGKKKHLFSAKPVTQRTETNSDLENIVSILDTLDTIFLFVSSPLTGILILSQQMSVESIFYW